MAERTEAESIANLAQKPYAQIFPQLLLSHNNYSTLDVEKYLDGRVRPRGTLETTHLEDFYNFLADHQTDHEAHVYVNHHNMAATAILNMITDDGSQGHCDFKAVLKLEKTVAWTKLLAVTQAGRFSQRDFATFLEDWADLLIALSPDNEVILARDAIHAVRNMTIEANSTSATNVTHISESRSVLENVAASSKENKLPAFFKIADTCYIGLKPREILLRLIINTSDSKPTFGLQIIKSELLVDALTQEFKQIIVEKLPENPVRIGTFSA